MSHGSDEIDWSQRVKQARDSLGLTQQELADRIGSTPLTVSRWERGIKVPSPYYRNKLETLFNSGLKETGTQRKLEKEGMDATRAIYVYDPAIPPLPATATGFIGRDELLRHLRIWLSVHGGSLALKGMYGIGKTALAAVLAHDDELRKRFRDGILWAGLGRKPNMFGLLSRWGTLLGITAVEMAKLTTVDAWARAIHDAIGMRRMLLIIDDAWEAEEALAFKVGGHNCTHIVTTRFREIAFQFTGDKITTVEELNEDNSVKLLAALVPDLAKSEPDELRELAQSVGGLPLALTIMGKHLQMQADSHQIRRVRDAIDRLHHAEERLQLTMLQPPVERPPHLFPGVQLSLQAAIEVSFQLLDEQSSYALRALSVFPPKSNSFSEDAALAICNVPTTCLDILVDTGLLESSGQDRYTVHQTIADFAKLQINNSEVEERMITYFVSYIRIHATEYDTIELETNNVLAAFQIVCKREAWSALIQGINALAPFLEARGIYSVAEPFLNQALDAKKSLKEDTILIAIYLHLARIDDLRGNFAHADRLYEEGLLVARKIEHREEMSAFLTYWGSMLVNRGDYIQAEQYLQEGLKLASELGNRQRMGVLLKNLGEVCDSRGKYQQGSELYQQGLVLARQVDDWETMSALLQNLGVNAERRGDFSRADKYYQEGIDCADKIKHQQRKSALLMNMGMLAYKRKNYREAKALYLESLEIARKIRNPVRISSVLQNLGMLEGIRKNYQKAAEYLQESLDIAYEINHTWLIYETLCEWGEIYLKQEKERDALVTFKKVLEKAREYQFQELIASALFGLARLALAQGDISTARNLGEESLTVLKDMEHEKVKVVEKWLIDELP